MWKLVQKLRQILPPKFKWGAIFLGVLMSVTALMELGGLALVMVIVSSFAKPELIHENHVLDWLYHFCQVSDDRQFVILLASALIAFYIIKNIICFAITCTQSRFAALLSLQFAIRLYRNYIRAPYSYHLANGSPLLISKITQVSNFITAVLLPLLLIATESLVVLALGISLCVIAPFIALLAGVSGIIFVLFLYFPLKRFSAECGRIQTTSTIAVQRVLQQGLAAVKDVKLTGTEAFFIKQLEQNGRASFWSGKRGSDIGQVPRFAMETFSVILAMGILIVLILLDYPFDKIMIFAAMFVAAMFRLLPSFSRIQYNLLAVKQGAYLFDQIYNDLVNFETESMPENEPEEISFAQEISGTDLRFAYAPDAPDVIHDFSFRIKCRETVAFVGRTGCGKSTLVDLIMGFYVPQAGRITVDGLDIQSHLFAWRRKIGYVSQNIVLFDDTIRANIAFGVEPAEIRDDLVRQVLATAQILDFVESLPEGLDTVIGEGGVRLSGGQRQRLAIARALYHSPELLVLDEATSALDNETEKAFIDALYHLQGKLTIIMIAHRLSSIEHCDRVIDLSEHAQKES